MPVGAIENFPASVIANIASATYTADGQLGPFDASNVHNLWVGFEVTVGSGVNVQLAGVGPDGELYQLGAYQNANGKTTFTPGEGAGSPTAPVAIPSQVYLIYHLGAGTATFHAWILGQP
jgi:hypothetical protein